MTFYIVGYIENVEDCSDDLAIGVYNNEAFANSAADKEWLRLKGRNTETFVDAEPEEENKRYLGFIDYEISVYIETVDSDEELKGFFKAKGWSYKDVEINKDI